MNVIYKVSPKELDSSNDELELREFNINCSYTKKAMNYETLPNADKWVSLDYNGIITGCFFCLQSNQPVSLAATVDGVTTQIAVRTRNMIIKGEYTAPFYVKNISGVDATIQWSYYGD